MRHRLTLMVLRSEEVNKLQAGIGQCLKLLLEDMFARDIGSRLRGIVLKSKQAMFPFLWDLHMFLQDGSAQKYSPTRQWFSSVYALQEHFQHQIDR